MAISKNKGSQIRLLAGLIIAVCTAVLIVHWPALSAETMFFDDGEYLGANRLVQNPGWDSTKRFFSEVMEPSSVHGYYQPLTMVSLMADYALGGRVDDLRQFHRTSLALHVANTALVIVLLYLLFGHAPAAAAAGLLFGLHPVTVEPIPWIGERKTLLAAFFALWCLVLYVGYARKNNWKLLAGSAGMYVLALLAKPTTVPLPALLLLMDFWPLRRLSKRAVLEKLPLFGIGAVFALVTIASQGRSAAVTMPTEYDFSRNIFILCHNIVFYLSKIVWPVGLCPYYPFPNPLAISQPAVLAGVVGTAILVPALIVSLRWTRALLTGWLFFFTAILPTMGIISFTVVIASDKYAYLPSVGLVMVLAWLLGKLLTAAKAQPIRRYAIIAVVLLAGVFESVVTIRCYGHWRKTEALADHLLSLVSDSPQVYSFAADELVRAGKLDEAVEYYKKAIEIGTREITQLTYKPTVTAHYNLGIVLGMQNKLDAAIEHFSAAVKLRKSYTAAHRQLAKTLVLAGRENEAVDHYKAVVELEPEDVVSRGWLGMMLAKLDRTEEALTQLQIVLAERPNDVEMHRNVGILLERQGRLDEAIKHYRWALEINPDFSAARERLEAALAKQDK